MNQAFIDDFKRGATIAPVEPSYRYVGEPVARYIVNDHVYLLVDVQPEEVELVEIQTDRAHRGHGYARKALGWLRALSNKHHMRIVVRPEPLDGCPMSAEQLAKWYFRQGLKVMGGVHCYTHKQTLQEKRLR
jgi:GNAT superfamily N-acetyltransferase